MKLDSWVVQANGGLAVLALVAGIPLGGWGVGALLLLFCALNGLAALAFLLRRNRRTGFTLVFCTAILMIAGSVLCTIYPLK